MAISHSKSLCCCSSFKYSFIEPGICQFGRNRFKCLFCFVVALLPPTFRIDGPAVGWVLYSQPVIDYVDHGTCNRNVHSSFQPQTSHSGKPDGVLDHALCSEVFNGSPIVVMKWLNIVVNDHEADAAHSVTKASSSCFPLPSHSYHPSL